MQAGSVSRVAVKQTSVAQQSSLLTSYCMEKTKVAIIGLGTVGQGVAKLLLDHGDRTARHAGRTLWLEKAVVRDLKKARDCDLPKGVLTDDVDEVINNPEIKVVAQLIGGLEPERTIMLRLLESGKDVVTANKALLAEHGPELFDRARELGRSIAFEASVAGGIPIIANISQCLSANQIMSLDGILNGTTNFILSKMHEEGVAYAEVLEEAQRLGYAEADPTLDVDGSDAAQKLAILAHLAFGARVDWKDIPRMGIDRLDVSDVRFAQEMGYRIKLLAVAELDGDTLELHVSPTLVQARTAAVGVSGPFNAIRVVGDAVGAAVVLRPGGRADADGVGRGGRHDRHGRRPHGDHVPHAGAVVESQGERHAARARQGRRAVLLAREWSKIIRACWRKWRACSAQHNISISQRAAAGSRWKRRWHRAARDHDARNDRRAQRAKACAEINKLKPVRGETVRMWVRD